MGYFSKHNSLLFIPSESKMKVACIFAVFGLAVAVSATGNGKAATAADLLAVGERLWAADNNRVAVEIDIQGKLPQGSSNDVAPDPLFPTTPAAINTRATYRTMQAVQDNYIRDTHVDEVDTAAEDAEIDAFLDAVFSTQVMQEAYDFLTTTGEYSGTYTAFQARVKELWFTTYIRQGGLSSSGFEHVFAGEMNGNDPTGLHNWVRHLNLEAIGDVNYLGYIEYLTLGTEASIITMSSEMEGQVKPISGFFVGTSPEFDFAVFTICYIAQPNSICNINILGQKTPIQTYDINCTGVSGGKCVASAYPA